MMAMPDSCCVKSCRLKRGNEKKNWALYRFPKDIALKEKWIKAIKNKIGSWSPSSSSKICSLHFKKIYLIPLKGSGKLRLAKCAIPSKFEGSEAIKEIRSKPRRLNLEKKKEAVNETLRTQAFQEDLVTLFEAFKNNYQKKLDLKSYRVYETDTKIMFYILQPDEIQGIIFKTRIILALDMSVKVFELESEVSKNLIKVGCMTNSMKITQWSQFQNILNNFIQMTDAEICPEMQISNAVKTLLILEQQENIFDGISLISILRNQLQNSLRKKPKYDIETVLFSFTMFTKSPSGYRSLREFLILPHPTYLQSLSASLNVSVDKEENISYLKNITKSLEEREKKVALLIDGIYIKEALVYKGSKVTGMAEDDVNETAKTVQCFMVKSVFGDFKEIINIHPTKIFTGEDLFIKTVQILEMVQKDLGLEVVCIITDNHRTNCNMYKSFSPDNEYFFDNPHLPGKKIFLFFDTVHLFKNIRNNWFNAKNSTFNYPDFETYEAKQAKVEDIRDMFVSEMSNPVKKAHKLNFQTLYPNRTERQKVVLADNIFHISTIAAIQEEHPETASFLLIIRKWWTIINVKSQFKAVRFRDEWAKPVTSQDSEILDFLEKFAMWLEEWKSMRQTGCLTTETYNALLHTTRALIIFCKHCLEMPGVQYILLGKVQTDDLENRFRHYRRLSGCNYDIGLVNILESEKKLRICKILKNFSIDDFIDDENSLEQYEIGEEFENIFADNYLDIITNPVDEEANLHASGYAAFALYKKVDCEDCRAKFIKGKGIPSGSRYLDVQQRGGLIVPQGNVVAALYHMCCIYNKILKEEHLLTAFLRLPNQKQILVELTLCSISQEGFNYFDTERVCTTCSRKNTYLYRIMLSPLANLIIKNYVRTRNYETEITKDCTRKNSLKKLKTFK